jgi:formylglycine-generating enzyme required for sulfatase activity
VEYEKACRGEDVYDTATNFYAWGTTGLTQVTGPSNSGAYNEVASNTGNGLCNYNNTMTGPFRAGFAATASTTRVTSGGAYYGGMDMSGNVWELCVTVGNTTGRSFIGTHGDGTLSTNGNATNADWPGASSGEVTGATGSGRRGGGYSDRLPIYTTSDRRYAAEA